MLLATPASAATCTAFFRLADLFAGMEPTVAETLVAAWRGDLAARRAATHQSSPRTADRRPVGTPTEVRREASQSPAERSTRDGTG